MPKAPALVGKLARAAMGRTARVTNVNEIAPGFLSVELRAQPPAGGWVPGHEIQVPATPTQGRRYSVSRTSGNDPEAMWLLAMLHAGGPGASWLRNLRPGSETALIAGRHVPLRIRGARRLHLGDASALGTFDAYNGTDHHCTTVIEVPPAAVEPLADRWPGYSFLPATDRPGDASQAWLEKAAADGSLHVDGALLLGHAQSIQRQRKALIAHGNLDRRDITTKPYWATGRNGL